MADDPLAILAEMAERERLVAIGYVRDPKDVPRLLAVAHAALKHHQPVQLYGLDTACGHDIDAGDWDQHFEGDDGLWYCKDVPTVTVCSACRGEDGGVVIFPCDEHEDIRAALLGEEADSGQAAS